MKKIILTTFVLLAILVISCKKEAGEGGTSTIKWKITLRNYHGNFPAPFYDDYDALAEDVYIIYGDGTTFDNRTKTSYDGTYEFNYLRKGTYTVFIYSDDTAIYTLPSPSGKILYIDTVAITKNKSEVIVPDIMITKQ